MVVVRLQRRVQRCGTGVQELDGRLFSQQETGLPKCAGPSNQPATLLKAHLYTFGLEASCDLTSRVADCFVTTDLNIGC